MKKFKVTIKSDIPEVHNYIVENENEFTINLERDPGLEGLNQIAGDGVVAHILDILEIDWDIEEV